MGTRNLTMVIKDKKPVVAQYGQWDGYFSGNGVIILNFLLNTSINKLSEQLDKVKFMDENDEKEVDEYLKSIGCKDGWMTGAQSDLYQKKYPYLTRDLGASVLQAIMDSQDEQILLTDSSSFAADSLFCEYAYVIDLDTRTFECYTGFNTKPLKKNERFSYLKKNRKDEYYPVTLLKSFSLDELPTEENFLKIMEELEEAKNKKEEEAENK